MKKLQVFEDMDRDIFFQPTQMNRLNRVHAGDRYKCFIWELLRTKCLVDNSTMKMVQSRKKVFEFEKEIFSGSEISEKNRLKYMELGKEAFPSIEEFGPLTMQDEFPITWDNFPSKGYLFHEPNSRLQWEHTNPEINYRNPTCSKPLSFTHILEQPSDDIKLYEFTQSSALTIAERQKMFDLKLAVSNKVSVNLCLDPMWSIGQLEIILREHSEEIHNAAQVEKLRLEKLGHEFSEPVHIPKKRTLRLIQTNLSYLGYYRLLECEKWGWDEANSAFDAKFSSGEKSKVIPKSLEHYRSSVRERLPDLVHSHIA